MFVCLSLFMGGGKGKKDNHAKWTTNFVKKYLNTKHACLLEQQKNVEVMTLKMIQVLHLQDFLLII